MLSRLATVAPKLEAMLSRATPAHARDAALSAARLATQACNLSAVVPSFNATVDDPAFFEGLVEQFDDEYFAAHERFEAGAAPESAYLVPFCRARAASSLAFALRDEPSEAVYEAIISTDNLSGVTRIVESILGHEA